MARDLSFLKMPEKSGDESMMDSELSNMNESSESAGVDLSEVTDEELMRECEKRGMKVEPADDSMGVEEPEAEGEEEDEEAEEEE